MDTQHIVLIGLILLQIVLSILIIYKLRDEEEGEHFQLGDCKKNKSGQTWCTKDCNRTTGNCTDYTKKPQSCGNADKDGWCIS